MGPHRLRQLAIIHVFYKLNLICWRGSRQLSGRSNELSIPRKLTRAVGV